MEYNNHTIGMKVLVYKTKYSINSFLYVDFRRGHWSCVLRCEESINWLGLQ
jgi:hypothetical protein